MKTLILPIALITFFSVTSIGAAQGPLGTGIFGTGIGGNLPPSPPSRTPSAAATTPNKGTLYIEAEYTVQKWNPGFYNREVRAAQSRISEISGVVDQLTVQYRQNPTPQNRATLIGWLNRLRDEKNQLAANKKTWRQPLKVRFNHDSVQHKQRLVERALQLGFAGKEIHFGSNRDGSKRVTLWHGKPNYGGKKQDVSHLF